MQIFGIVIELLQEIRKLSYPLPLIVNIVCYD